MDLARPASLKCAPFGDEGWSGHPFRQGPEPGVGYRGSLLEMVEIRVTSRGRRGLRDAPARGGGEPHETRERTGNALCRVANCRVTAMPELRRATQQQPIEADSPAGMQLSYISL
jgi:hypothetical protein